MKVESNMLLYASLILILATTTRGKSHNLLFVTLWCVYIGCTHGNVRLVGGSNQYEGRVEVCINGNWHSVCDDDWEGPDATVVCRQLGYSYTGCKNNVQWCVLYNYTLRSDYAEYYGNAHFGRGNGTIAIADVACVGTETSLLSCSSSAIFGTLCTHSEDAGVGCEGMYQ